MEVGNIVLGARGVKVEQVIDDIRTKIIVAGSVVLDRDPCSEDEEELYRRVMAAAARNPTIEKAPEGKTWCIGMDGGEGHWADTEDFSQDTRKRNGLCSQCKHCRNASDRRIYRIRQEARGRKVRPYNKSTWVGGIGWV